MHLGLLLQVQNIDLVKIDYKYGINSKVACNTSSESKNGSICSMLSNYWIIEKEKAQPRQSLRCTRKLNCKF